MARSTSTVSSVVDDNIRGVLRYLRDRPRLRVATLLFLPVSVLTVFFVLPLFSMLSMSFLTDIPPAPFTVENYTRIFASDLYLQVLWRTTVITVQTTLIVVVLGYSFAYSTVRFSRRTTLILLLLILPFWTNYIVRMYAWMNILQSNGVLDTLFLSMGVISDPMGILYSNTAVLIGFTYIWLPLSTLAFYASIVNLDTDLLDASKDLGAGPIRTFFTVTLPLTKDGVIVGIILVAIPTFGAFVTPALLGGTDNIMIGMVIESQFLEAFNWPFGAALGTVVSIFVIVMTIAAVAAGGNVFAGGESE